MKKINFLYKENEIVNESLKIVKQTTKYYGKYKTKAYEVQSLTYPKAPTYIIAETSLMKGVRDSYVYGNRVCEYNSLWSIKRLRKYIVDKDKAKTVLPRSHKKIKVKCLECSNEKYIRISTLTDRGVGCHFCSTNISYPEIFMIAYLQVKGIEFEYQKTFKDLTNRKFDFYIKNLGVIETHGEQHYKNNKTSTKEWENAFKKAKISDEEKEEFCKSNNIPYIVINCEKSEFDYIKKEISKCHYLENITKKEEEVMLKTIEDNKKYPVKEIIKLYEELGSCKKVGERFNLSSDIIRNVLKRNNIIISKEIKKEYPVKEIIKLYKKLGSCKKVGERLNLNENTIRNVLKRNKVKIKKYNNSKVRCITTNKEFNSIKEASEYYKINHATSISSCCRKKRKTAGKHPESLEPLEWEYVNE